MVQENRDVFDPIRIGSKERISQLPTGGFVIVVIFSIVLAAFAIVSCVRRAKLGQLVIIVCSAAAYLCALVHFLGLPAELGGPSFHGKGSEDNTRFYASVAVLMVCIIVGMIAEFFHSWLDGSRGKRPPIDWLGGVIKPILVSPLVLMPTLAAFQNAQIDLTALGFPWLMMMLTAFEKGFLWRHFMKKSSMSKLQPQSEL